MKFPGSLDSRRWVFVREGPDDFRKDCPPHQSSKDAFLPHIHHRVPTATPTKRQTGLPREEPLLSRLSKAGKAFLEDVDANTALHPLALYPNLEEALPAEVIYPGSRKSLLGALKQFSPEAQQAPGVQVRSEEVFSPAEGSEPAQGSLPFPAEENTNGEAGSCFLGFLCSHSAHQSV